MCVSVYRPTGDCYIRVNISEEKTQLFDVRSHYCGPKRCKQTVVKYSPVVVRLFFRWIWENIYREAFEMRSERVSVYRVAISDTEALHKQTLTNYYHGHFINFAHCRRQRRWFCRTNVGWNFFVGIPHFSFALESLISSMQTSYFRYQYLFFVCLCWPFYREK